MIDLNERECESIYIVAIGRDTTGAIHIAHKNNDIDVEIYKRKLTLRWFFPPLLYTKVFLIRRRNLFGNDNIIAVPYRGELIFKRPALWCEKEYEDIYWRRRHRCCWGEVGSIHAINNNIPLSLRWFVLVWASVTSDLVICLVAVRNIMDGFLCIYQYQNMDETMFLCISVFMHSERVNGRF